MLEARRKLLLGASAGLALSLTSPRARSVVLSPLEEKLAAWESFGWHWSGSSAQSDSAEWLAHTVSSVGMRCEILPFTFEHTQVDACTVQSASHRILGLPLFNHAGTSASGVIGVLVNPPDMGDIALLTLPPQARAEEALAKLAVGAYRAAVIVTTGSVPGLAPLDCVKTKSPLPVVQVSSEALGWLNQAVSDRAQVSVVARVTKSDGIGHNVLAARAGSSTEAPPLVITTGMSGWGPCTGERGGPLCIWLTTAIALAAAPPERGVVMLAADAEEIGALGRASFAADFTELVQKAPLWLELGANLGSRESTLQLQAEPSDAADGLARRLGTDGLRFSRRSSAPEDVPATAAVRMALHASPAPRFHLPGDLLPSSTDLDVLGRLAVAVGRAVIELTRL